MAAGAVIPQSRTHETQTIVSTVRAGANVVQGVNLQQLVQAMTVTNQDLEAVPSGATSSLLKGLSELSDVIASRSGELAQLVQNVSQLTATLHQHGTQLFSLIGQSDLVLQVLNQRHAEIDQLLKSTAVLTQQLEALLSAHQAQVGPLLSDLETVSGVLAKDGNEIEAAIPLLTSANKYLANVTGSGAFGDFVMPAALIPDNVIAQCSKPGADQRRSRGATHDGQPEPADPGGDGGRRCRPGGWALFRNPGGVVDADLQGDGRLPRGAGRLRREPRRRARDPRRVGDSRDAAPDLRVRRVMQVKPGRQGPGSWRSPR